MSLAEQHKHTIIIGAGIAGLYAAYKIRCHSPDTSILIIEKNDKRWVGGRANNEMFQGASIVTGAGIGRYRKDKLLRKLMQEMNVAVEQFPVVPQYSSVFSPVNAVKIFKQLRSEYKGESQTFRKYATAKLGERTYTQFIWTVGYTDYEEEDAGDVLFNYGMEDNICKYKGFSVPWRVLVNKLMKKIGEKYFRFECKVDKIKRESSGEIMVYFQGSPEYTCDNLIIATPINTIQKLLPDMSIYKEIVGQPFLRLYAKFTVESHRILKEVVSGHIVVPPPLQKIIPMSNGVYMIAYSDNAHATRMKKYIENNETNRQKCCELVERSLGISPGSLRILALKANYWEIGTHYCVPLNRRKWKDREEFLETAQNPFPNVKVVGEAVSMNQGWVEGALDSVDRIL